MAMDPSSPTSARLTQLHQALQSSLEAAKSEIETRVGNALTDINAKLVELNAGIRGMEEAGKKVMDTIDQEKANTTTQLHGIIAGAQSEFQKHRAAI